MNPYPTEGLRAWIRVNLKLTNTRLQFPIRIRELRNVPFVHPTIQKPPKASHDPYLISSLILTLFPSLPYAGSCASSY
eukprot:1342878-Amorphochlora_amoeboformis.AAC.1